MYFGLCLSGCLRKGLIYKGQQKVKSLWKARQNLVRDYALNTSGKIGAWILRKSVRPIIENIIAYYVPVAVGGLVLILAGLSRQLQLWQLLALALGLCAIILLLINQVAVWKVRRKRRLTQLPSKEFESEISEWITTTAWSIQPLELAEGASFARLIKYNDLPIQLKRTVKEPLVVQLTTGLRMSSAKMALSDAQWQDLVTDLRIEMARFGIQFDFVGDKQDTLRLTESVTVDDSMTGFLFRPRIMFVVRAYILAVEVYKEALMVAGKPILDK